MEEWTFISCCSHHCHAQVLIIKNKAVEAPCSFLRYLIWDAEDQVGPFSLLGDLTSGLDASLKDPSRQMADLGSGLGRRGENSISSILAATPPWLPQYPGPIIYKN